MAKPEKYRDDRIERQRTPLENEDILNLYLKPKKSELSKFSKSEQSGDVAVPVSWAELQAPAQGPQTYDIAYDATGMPVARAEFIGPTQSFVLRRKEGIEGAVEDMQVGIVRRRLNEWVRYDNGTGFFKPGNAETVVEGIADELYRARRLSFKHGEEVTDASIRGLLRLREHEARRREGSFGPKDKLNPYLEKSFISNQFIEKTIIPYLDDGLGKEFKTPREERDAERTRELADIERLRQEREAERTRTLSELQAETERQRQERLITKIEINPDKIDLENLIYIKRRNP